MHAHTQTKYPVMQQGLIITFLLLCHFFQQHKVSEVLEDNEALQREIQELELTIESKNNEIEELNFALDKKHQSLLVANDQLKEAKVHVIIVMYMLEACM